MSRTDIASDLGMSLECLSRVLTRLRKAGTVAVTLREIRLLDRDRLAGLADHLAG